MQSPGSICILHVLTPPLPSFGPREGMNHNNEKENQKIFWHYETDRIISHGWELMDELLAAAYRNGHFLSCRTMSLQGSKTGCRNARQRDKIQQRSFCSESSFADWIQRHDSAQPWEEERRWGPHCRRFLPSFSQDNWGKRPCKCSLYTTAQPNYCT